MDLSYCVSSCGTTIWVLCWSCDGRVANLKYLIIMENYKGGLTRKVFCLRYTQMIPIAMYSGVGTDPKKRDWREASAGQGAAAETGHREIVQMYVGQPKLYLVMSAGYQVKKTKGSKKRVQGQHWFDAFDHTVTR